MLSSAARKRVLKTPGSRLVRAALAVACVAPALAPEEAPAQA